MKRGIAVFVGQITRWVAVFVLATMGVIRYFYRPLQPQRFLSLIGETATQEQLAVVHRQLDPIPHTFLYWYIHWARGLYLPQVFAAIVCVSLLTAVVGVRKRTPHETDPRVSAYALVSG